MPLTCSHLQWVLPTPRMKSKVLTRVCKSLQELALACGLAPLSTPFLCVLCSGHTNLKLDNHRTFAQAISFAQSVFPTESFIILYLAQSTGSNVHSLEGLFLTLLYP